MESEARNNNNLFKLRGQENVHQSSIDIDHGGHGHPSLLYHRIGSFTCIHLIHRYPNNIHIQHIHLILCTQFPRVYLSQYPVGTYCAHIPSIISERRPSQYPIGTYGTHISSMCIILITPGVGIPNWIALLSSCETILVKGMIHGVRVLLFLTCSS